MAPASVCHRSKPHSPSLPVPAAALAANAPGVNHWPVQSSGMHEAGCYEEVVLMARRGELASMTAQIDFIYNAQGERRSPEGSNHGPVLRCLCSIALRQVKGEYASTE